MNGEWAKQRDNAATIATVVLTTMLGMQLLRAGLPYFQFLLRDRLGWSTINAGLIAAVIFATAFLAGPLDRILGTRRLLLLSGTLVGASRMSAQIWTADPIGDMLLIWIGIIGFLLFLPVAAASSLTGNSKGSLSFAAALLGGIALDVTVNGFLLTYDLIWQEGVWQLLTVAVLVAAQLWLLAREARRVPQTMDAQVWPAMAWAIFGPFVFLQLLQFANIAWLTSETGWTLEAAYFCIVLAQSAGLAIWLLPGKANLLLFTLSWPLSIGVLALQFSGWSEPWLSAVYILFGQIALAGSMVTLLPHLAAHTNGPGLKHLSFAGGVGSLLLVVFLFAFYAAYDLVLPVGNNLLPLIALLMVGILSIGAQRYAWQSLPTVAEPVRALASLLVIMLLAPLLLAMSTAAPPQLTTPGTSLRAMTYNLHNGFNPLGQLDLEALAQVIESEEIDIVGFQEVSRGWVINGSVDMLYWLAHRLHMTPTFGATADDQWGNAVLSRLPIITSTSHPLPGEDLLLKRGFMQVDVEDKSGNEISVINTHYHNPEEGGLVRQDQSDAILTAISGMPRTLLMGDLNAQPGMEEIERLRRAGLQDVLDVAEVLPGYTNPVPEPWRRIDYIWITDDWKVDEAAVPYTEASDHLPVVTSMN